MKIKVEAEVKMFPMPPCATAIALAHVVGGTGSSILNSMFLVLLFDMAAC